MIYSLRGKLIYTGQNFAVIECSGVGYRCTVTANTLRRLPAIGQEAFVFTYMSVREDAVDLFGFAGRDELDMFRMLISVNGVGPKAAVAILSVLTPEALTFAIMGSDTKSITKAPGVGAKIAQRIVLELKDKVSYDGNADAAISALIALGYSQSEAASALAKVDASLSVEQMIKDALKYLF